MSTQITDAMVEAATMKLLGKTVDPLPGVDWWASRQWRVNKVREKMRKALEAAALAASRTEQAAPSVASGVADDALKQWAWHWFGPEADEQWIAQALANMPKAAAPGAAIAAREQEASNWLWRHKKSGGLYRLIGSAQLQTDKPLNDLSEVEVYQSEDGRLLWVRDAAEFHERFERAQPLASRQEATAAKPPAKTELLSQGEQRAILEDAGAIIRLVNHHDVKETEADAANCAGAAAFHMKRAHELLTIGRCVILRDPELWDDQLKQEFAPRAREG